MKTRSFLLATACMAATLTGAFAQDKPAAAAAKPAAPAKAAAKPGNFKVHFVTSKGDFDVQVHPDWAPLGAAHFKELVKAGYYDNARFFRVLPGFVVQFGLAADPKVTAKWNHPIKDDAVKAHNTPGTLVYATAGPNTRTTQLFINYGNNAQLDGMGFAPFAEVLGDGMTVAKQIYSGDGESPNQGAITAQGNAYLNAKFPKLDYIKKATIVE